MHVYLFVKRAFAYDVIISTYGFVYGQTMGKAKNVVYSQFLRSLKHIYKSIYIHRWDTGTQLQWRVSNMARNDLRARGGLGGGRSAPPTRCWGGAKRHPNS